MWKTKTSLQLHKNMELQMAVTLQGMSMILLKIKTLFGLHKIMKPKERYEFVENQDFVTFSENSEKGRPRLEYALTLDKTSLLGLRTVLSGTNLWRTKTLLQLHKKMERENQ